MAKKTKKTEEITKKFGDERRKALDDATRATNPISLKLFLFIFLPCTLLFYCHTS